MVALSKEQIKEMDRAMLQRWEAGELEKDLRRDYPKVKVRVNCYRALGVVSGTVNEGNKAVDWVRFEEVDPPGMRNRGGGKADASMVQVSSKPTIQVSDKHDASMVQVSYKHPVQASGKYDASMEFSREEVEALREMLRERRTRTTGEIQTTGPSKAVTYKLPCALLEALARRADADGVAGVEVLRRALAVYLGTP